MPRDITVTFSDGSSTVYKNAPDTITPEQVTARAQQEHPNLSVMELDGGSKSGGLKEVGRVLDKGVRGGLTAFSGFLGDTVIGGSKALPSILPDMEGLKPGMLPPQLDMMVQAIKGLQGSAKAEDGLIKNAQMPSQVIQTVGGALPPLSKPETEPGKAAGNVLEAMVATLMGGGSATLGQKLGIGFSSGAGGEVAERVTGDTSGLARLGGSLLGGGGAAVYNAWKSNSENLIRQATQDVSPQEWRRAKVLEATLEKEGMPHLKSQLLGEGSSLPSVVSVAGTHPAARPKLIQGTKNADVEAGRALERKMLTHLPPNVGERAEVLDDIQSAAQSKIKNLFNQANNRYRANMPPEDLAYPKDSVTGLRDLLIETAKSPKYGETTDAGKAIMALADDLMLPGGKWDYSGVNPVILARAKKAGEDLTQLPGAKLTREPVTNAHQINNLIKELNLKATKDNYKGLPVEEVKTLLKTFTDEFADARAAKTDFMRGSVNPTQKSLTGQIAQMGGGQRPDKATAKVQAVDLVFNSGTAQPKAIRNLSADIGADHVGELLREHVARTMQKTWTGDLGAVETRLGSPSRFINEIAGQPAKRANLEAAIDEVSKANGQNPAAVRNGFYKLMRAFESYKNARLPDSVDRAALSQEAGKSVPGVLVAPHSRIGRLFWEKATAKTYGQIADIVLSKDGLKQLEVIARSEKPTLARTYAFSVLSSLPQAEAGESD